MTPQFSSNVEVGILVFARMNSRRLPGKPLVDIGGRPLLGHVLDRLLRVRDAAGTVLATSADPADDPLERFAESEDLPCCRGPLNDVVRRAVDCARAHGWTAFARVCGDRVFLAPAFIDSAISRMKDELPGSVDLVTNTLAGGVAAGLTTEVIAVAALARLLGLTREPEHLEHVTSYFYARPAEFTILSITPPPLSTAGLRFVVDTARDLARARDVAASLSAPATADLSVVADRIRAWELERPQGSADGG